VGELRTFVTPLHLATRRDYLGRMIDDKVACSRVARRFARDYWDGDRRFGYGGYRYDGRWKPVAQALIAAYGLGSGARILDVGCGKAHLLHELHELLPGSECVGIDVSDHGLADAPAGIRPHLRRLRAEDPLPWDDGYFDLVLSLGCIHNLRLPDAARALASIQRVGRRGYVLMESYRDEAELFNLQCWALTCESFLAPEAWTWLFGQAGYRGDFEFIFFP
jgi:SAM-dependent methyltransferase